MKTWKHTTPREKAAKAQRARGRAGSEAEAAAAAARRKLGVQRTKWAQPQGVELSKLVLGFTRFSKRLPDSRDHPFWQLCHNHFNGVFTWKQMQAKLRYFHSRFRRLADGTVKTLHLGERDNLRIWTQIMRYLSHYTHQRSSSSTSSTPSTRSRSLSPPPSNYKDCGATTHQAWGIDVDVAFHANADGKLPHVVREYARRKPTTSFEYARRKPTTSCEKRCHGADEGEHAREASGCSTQMNKEDDDEEEKVKDKGVDDADATAPGTAPASAAAEHHHDHINVRMNIALLHHATVADLASAVKTLADIVARSEPTGSYN